jgi:hypothetical protein
MTVTTHQPIFLPWPGFFFKAMSADCMVLLDNVQFPLGRGWMNRNRLKDDKGELWLTVPVQKKGKGLQSIHKVNIFNKIEWRKKHLRGILQNYAHAPFAKQYFPAVEAAYEKAHKQLVSMNLDLIYFFWEALSLKTELLLQSDLKITGKGTEILIDICKYVNARNYMAFSAAKKYLDLEQLTKNGIQTTFVNFTPPIYPQLWGDFIYNLSTLDLLLNCGPKSIEIISQC